MARIVFTLEDGVEIETELDTDVITVGRHPDSIVVLPSASVSSHHATIKRRGEDFYVQDLGTTNGTKLNGVEVEEAKLEHGDTVTFGDIPGAVHLTDAPFPTKAGTVEKSVLPTPDFVVPTDAPVPSTARRKPAAKKAKPKRAATPAQYRESSGCAGFLMFLVFVAVAFIVGLHVRHGVETGRFLLTDVIEKYSGKAAEHLEQAPASSETAPKSEPAPADAAPAPAPNN